MIEAASPRSGDIVGRNYAIDRALGEGGMGAVYLARHVVTGRRVALKWARAESALQRERILREARSMGRLAHPNVVGVLDAGEEGGAVFTVMEYADGQNLRTFVDGRVIDPADAIDLLMPVLAGVAAAHQAGILHRDLKPENLFVCTDRDGTALDTKVLDFGIAKFLDDSETSLTSSGTIIGTPKYMAPEQVINSADVDVRADVYALALILYELLAGRLPYNGTGLKALVVEIVAGRLTPLAELRPELPEALCAAVMKGFESERDFRYADIATFAHALEPFAGRRAIEYGGQSERTAAASERGAAAFRALQRGSTVRSRLLRDGPRWRESRWRLLGPVRRRLRLSNARRPLEHVRERNMPAEVRERR